MIQYVTQINYTLVVFMCALIVICYIIGFIMGRIFEKSKQEDIEQAAAEAKAAKTNKWRR